MVETLLPAGEASRDLETGLTKSDLLEIRVWLRLLTCTNLIEQRIRQNLRSSFGITLPRFDILAQLHRAPDGLTMGELSRRLMVSNGNVTGLIERLVREGLVVRRSSPGDRRSQVVRLTAAGEKALVAMLPVHHRWVERMFASLEPDEMATLLDLLARLKESLAGEVSGESDSFEGRDT